MADRIVAGFALGVRDVPQRGMTVSVVHTIPGLYLEPSDAADLGYALVAQANEAMLAEQAKRRSTR